MFRRHLLRALPGLGLAALITNPLAHAAGGKVPIEVWKDAGCGCCGDWIKHLQAHGFDVKAHDGGNTAKRAQMGLPANLGSCHTGVVGGYLVEGHVPAAEIQRLLREKPRALGLAVPGMPIGSPGMDAPIYGGRKDRYDVLLVNTDGSTRIYKTYPST